MARPSAAHRPALSARDCTAPPPDAARARKKAVRIRTLHRSQSHALDAGDTPKRQVERGDDPVAKDGLLSRGS